MPIHCPVNIRNLSADEFEKIDYRVMGHAYASQNELGRLCDECAYHFDLKARLLEDGIPSVLTEIPATVTHRDFSKKYFLDLLADNALYELKTDAALIGEHEKQLFNYLFLLGIQRGKLLNFRPLKVQGKILATGLTPEKRKGLTIRAEYWEDLSPSCSMLQQTMLELLQDWGAFLDFALYQEALIHLSGGGDKIEQLVSIGRSGIPLGNQRMFVHSPNLAFRVTAFTENQDHIALHLRRLLALTNLKAIQWINLNHEQIEFTTIEK